jgi:hypothetical protein
MQPLRAALVGCLMVTAIGGILSSPLFEWANATVAGTPMLQQAIASPVSPPWPPWDEQPEPAPGDVQPSARGLSPVRWPVSITSARSTAAVTRGGGPR